MAETISVAYVKTFEDNVRAVAQQMVSKLRPYVQIDTSTGSSHVWNLMSPVDMAAKSRRTTTLSIANDTPFATRMAVSSPYITADIFEQEDIVQMLIDPQSELVMNHARAGQRQIDDLIIDAATAAAANNEGGTVAFLAGQEVGAYADYFSFDLITKVSNKFMANDVDPMEKKCIIIGPNQAQKMLQLTEFTSSEYNRSQVAALNSPVGYLPDFIGYEWIVSTRLNAPAANQIDCLAMTRRAIGLHLPMDYKANIAQDPSLQFAWVVQGMLTGGAVRIEDKHIVRIKANDTAL